MQTVDRPGGLLRRYAGDWRSLLPGTAAGMMQLMYPPLGRGVMEHSEFVKDPFGRIYRSIPQIWAVLLTDEPGARGRHIRDLHGEVRGRNDDGSRYHALDPETFWWAHATFTWEIFRSIELFRRRQLTDAEKDRLYDDSVWWYGCYGVSSRPVPPDRTGFEAKFDRICDEVLEITPAARMVLDMTRDADRAAAAMSHAIPIVPDPLMRLGVRARQRSGRVSMLGCLPSRLRHRFSDDLSMSTAEQIRFGLAARAIQLGFTMVPPALNQLTMTAVLRQVGHRTRSGRYVPHSRRSLAVGS